MSILGYAIFRLKGQVFIHAGGAYASLDEAMGGIEFHYRNNPFGGSRIIDPTLKEQQISLASYGPAEDGWKSRVVEVRKADNHNMVTFAVYKILECHFRDEPESDAAVTSAVDGS